MTRANATNYTNKLGKVDFFTADRELSTRVVDFMRCKVWKKELQLKYSKEIESHELSLDKLDIYKGSIMEDRIPELRAAHMARIAELEFERDAQIEKETKFAFTEGDKEFKKVLKKAGTASDLVADAVCAWFATYGLDIRNTYFLEEVLGQFGSKFDFRAFVASNATDARALDVNRALEMVYCSAYTHMLQAGTIKATQIPELVRDKYAPKKAKKAKKASK